MLGGVDLGGAASGGRAAGGGFVQVRLNTESTVAADAWSDATVPRSGTPVRLGRRSHLVSRMLTIRVVGGASAVALSGSGPVHAHSCRPADDVGPRDPGRDPRADHGVRQCQRRD